MFDLVPATTELGRLVKGVRDEQLTLPTPCTDVPEGSSRQDRTIGRTGRDPGWTRGG